MNMNTLKNDMMKIMSFLAELLFSAVRKVYLKSTVAVYPMPQTPEECRILAARSIC